MPQMGVSVSEGTITKWLKQPGETVAQDEPLLEISTDKVDTEVPSPGEGVVAEILVGEGQTVEVGTVLAVIVAGAAVADAELRTRAARPAPVAQSHAPAPAEQSGRAAGRSWRPLLRRPSPRRRRRQVAQSYRRSRGPGRRRAGNGGRRSSRPSSPASPPSTGSTRARFRAPGRAGG